jgi:hypothetical protein
VTEQGPFRLSLGSSGGVGGPTAYSNNVQLLLSSWDITFEFSQFALIPSEEEGQPPVASKIIVQRIVMSPQHAKAFLNILSENLDAWERQFGEIQLPRQEPNPPQTGEGESQ